MDFCGIVEQLLRNRVRFGSADTYKHVGTVNLLSVLT
jgi:hypothetical protein